MKNKKQIKDLSELPPEIYKEIEKALTEDILERYDNDQYQDKNIMNLVLDEHGYELI